MSDTPDVKSCVSREAGDRVQSPFCSLNYHFGMLLGVGDFETEQTYHRGKMWLHTASLHREGVVWGFDVQADEAQGEVRVLPGLAVDALGREIHLEADACLDVAAWFRDRREKVPEDDDWFVEDTTAGTVVFDGHVVIRFKSCLTRQVPSLASPCENAETSTAYSRRCETVEILFRPGLAPDPFEPGGAEPPPPRPYRRLRLLFGLETPERDEAGEIVEADREVLESPRTADSIRRWAALDEIDLRPPEGDEFPVLLANVHDVTLTRDGDDWTVSVGSVDVTVRPAHIATAALQDLLGAPGGSGSGAVVLPESVALDEAASQLTLVASAALAPASVQTSAFQLTAFDPAAGWSVIALDSVTLEADERTLTLDFSTGGIPTAAELVRLVVQGAGTTPVLDANLVPFNHGQDFIHDHRRS